MRQWRLCAGALLMVGALLVTLCGCGHDPNHDINMEKARAAAERVHPAPKLTHSERAKVAEDHGG